MVVVWNTSLRTRILMYSKSKLTPEELGLEIVLIGGANFGCTGLNFCLLKDMPLARLSSTQKSDGLVDLLDALKKSFFSTITIFGMWNVGIGMACFSSVGMIVL